MFNKSTVLFTFFIAMASFSYTEMGYCGEEIKLEDLKLLRVIELKAQLDHVQGIAVNDDYLWVTSVNRKNKTGHVHQFEIKTGTLIQQAEVQEGERYHPGGLSLDGNRLWIPVAAYRRESEASIQCRDSKTLELISSFSIEDHIGCIAADGDNLIGGNWDSLNLYFWNKKGALLKKIDNPCKTRYQDIKAINGVLIASGSLNVKGAIDWIDLKTMKLIKRIIGGKTDRDVNFMNEGMAVSGNNLYLLPEDGPSRLFIFALK